MARPRPLTLAVALTFAFATVPGAAMPASASSDAKHDVSLERFHRMQPTVASGKFHKIYDPSVGESEAWYINDHTIVRGPDGTWHLFGITHAEPADAEDELTFAHATAASLKGPWKKRAPALTVDRDYGERHLWAPHVVRHGDTYYMYYAGGGKDHTSTAINLATSKDLFHWKRHPGGTLFRDGFEARDPMVRRVGGRWVMYYTANDDPAGGHHIVAYRTSSDLVHWGKRHVAYTSPDTGTGAGNTESPFVVQHGGSYYLFVGPCGSYAGGRNTYNCTDVYRSDNPLHFDRDQHVGRIRAHAPEVVQDVDGTDHITHAGWGEGGVHLARLDWNRVQRQAGVRVKARHYTAELLTAPVTRLTSLRARGAAGGRNLVDTAFRGTTPYLTVGEPGEGGEPGDAVTPGAAHDVRLDHHDGKVTLSKVKFGDQPVRVDWTFRFTQRWFDTGLRWHVNDRPDASLSEAGWSIDTTLPQVGDDERARRGTGTVEGFPRWTMATDDSVSLVAAYRRGSAWQECNRWFNPQVGAAAWQSVASDAGCKWSPGTYSGGTWRLGVSGKKSDTEFADELYGDLNG